ncbi:hypothetical protein ASF49_00445 [Methylobacterium sp. Leaf104]|uniref:hypothetical protein n=1 Tax=Methylobacterium TaxID=407 RepID=UPI0006F1E215|nr:MULTISPECIES: hypothetical protein [Methylobacterium]KQP42369.1 hypothetical protein ASF49_00445 [Methylobacterium sp. Leaf104]MCI9879113.1 hypothetical protein [Methylobacterium goesingense]
MSFPVPACRGTRARALAALVPLVLAGCGPRAPVPTPAATAPIRERLAALALSRTEFGSVSLIPVRFVQSRVSGPFLDEGRTLYCVSSRMRGRTFGKAERVKIVIQEKAGTLTVIDEDKEACDHHRTEPLPELEAMAAAKT